MERTPVELSYRHAAIAGAGLIGCLLLYRILESAPKRVLGPGRGDRSGETFPLSDQRSDEVFGLGPGVTIQTREKLRLKFEYLETLPSVTYLRFEAQGVEKAEEVEVRLNGLHLTWVTPGLGSYTKEQSLKLPGRLLQPGSMNEIEFENILEPTASEPWAISKLRLVTKFIPICQTQGECLRESEKLFLLAEDRMRSPEIAARNNYDAWISLGKAILFLEGIEPKPELYRLARQLLREADRRLEMKCNQVLLTAKKFEQLGALDKSVEAYQQGLMYFGDEHACRARILEKLERS
jgi:hypothetical protein